MSDYLWKGLKHETKSDKPSDNKTESSRQRLPVATPALPRPRHTDKDPS